MMFGLSLESWVIGLMLSAFFWQTGRHQQFQWLWFAVVLWLVLGIFSARLLPNVLGITRIPNLFIVHFYMFMGSVFFFMNSSKRQPEKSDSARILTWQNPEAGSWLTTFAVSGAVMHAAFLLLCVLVWLQYPRGYTAMLPAQLLKLYALDPVYWFSIQLLMMLLFAGHRLMLRQPVYVFSLGQIQGGFLLALILFFFYITNVYQYIMPLIYYFFLKG